MTDPRSATDQRSPWTWVLVAVLLVAAGLRILGLRTELWMDEILSLRLVGDLESPLDVFNAIHHDNNHYLNSLWIYGVGTEARSWVLRLPPLILGVGLVALASAAMSGRGRRAALGAALLVGLSYPLIHFSSEARGYAYVLFFALLAYLLLQRWLRTRGAAYLAVYSVSATLGFLAHLGFATVFAALVLWSALDTIRASRASAGPLLRLLAAHAVPAAVITVLYLVDFRELTVAGGPPLAPLDSWRDAAGLLVGGARGWLTMPVAAAALAAVLLELRAQFARREAGAWFFTCVLALPLAYPLVTPHAYERYYLTALLFALLLLAGSIGRMADDGGYRRWAAIALLTVVVGLNLYQTVRFLAGGRGRYSEAVAAMVTQSSSDRPTVAGNRDMDHILTIDHYAARLPNRPSFVYYCSTLTSPGCVRLRPSRNAGESPPEYYVLASWDDPFEPPESLDIPDMATYALEDVYPKYGLSGVTWAVYRSTD